MILIEPKSKNESIEAMLRRLRKKINQNGVMQELWYRRYYKKPSLRKRVKKKKNWS